MGKAARSPGETETRPPLPAMSLVGQARRPAPLPTVSLVTRRQALAARIIRARVLWRPVNEPAFRMSIPVLLSHRGQAPPPGTIFCEVGTGNLRDLPPAMGDTASADRASLVRAVRVTSTATHMATVTRTAAPQAESGEAQVTTRGAEGMEGGVVAAMAAAGVVDTVVAGVGGDRRLI